MALGLALAACASLFLRLPIWLRRRLEVGTGDMLSSFLKLRRGLTTRASFTLVPRLLGVTALN